MEAAKMKVGTRLSIGFGIILLFLAGIMALSIFSMGSINAGTEKLVEEEWNKSKLVVSALDNARGSIGRVFQLTVEQDQDHLAKAKDRLSANVKAFNEAIEKLEKKDFSPEGKNLVAKSRQTAKQYMVEYEKVLAMLNAGKRDDASRYAFGTVYSALQVFATNLRDLNDYQQKVFESEGQKSKATYESVRSIILTTGLITILLGIAAAFIITRSLIKQLGGEPDYAAGIVARIAAGDLSVTIDTRANDSGSLLLAMKAMRDSLVQIIGKVRVGTDVIATASQQIAAGNMDLSSRTEQQAGSLEETASSMEELTGTVKQNADNARQANQLAINASDIASQGGAVVTEVVETMGAINASSKKIVDIISVIDGIAFQTNILALNAAVEAARAGEQGRGFAVVATEVRNLAHRSASAAKEIKTLIGDSVDKVDAGAKLVDQAGTTMQAIVESVKRVTDIMGEIMSATNEQTAGIEQISQAITQMDQVTQQNAALVEEAAAAADSLQDQAGNLSQVMSTFKLDDQAERKPSLVFHKTEATALPPARRTNALAPVADRGKPERSNQKPILHKKAAQAEALEWEEF